MIFRVCFLFVMVGPIPLFHYNSLWSQVPITDSWVNWEKFAVAHECQSNVPLENLSLLRSLNIHGKKKKWQEIRFRVNDGSDYVKTHPICWTDDAEFECCLPILDYTVTVAIPWPLHLRGQQKVRRLFSQQAFHWLVKDSLNKNSIQWGLVRRCPGNKWLIKNGL